MSKDFPYDLRVVLPACGLIFLWDAYDWQVALIAFLIVGCVFAAIRSQSRMSTDEQADNICIILVSALLTLGVFSLLPNAVWWVYLIVFFVIVGALKGGTSGGGGGVVVG